jgi:Mg2+/citrate symporter
MDPTALLALMIPIIAIILAMGSAMLAMYLGYRKRKDIFTLYHQERMAALEKGVEVPPLPEALFSESARPYNPRRHLFTGLAWLFVGLGLGVALYVVAGHWALFSLIPIGIGLAHLIYYFVEGRREAAEAQPAQAPAAPPASLKV